MSERPPRVTTAELARLVEIQRKQLDELDAHVGTIRAFLVQLGISHEAYDALFPSVLASPRQFKPQP